MPEWLEKAEHFLARPLREQVSVGDLSELRVVRLQVCENLRHERFRRMMSRVLFEVRGDPRTAHTEISIPPTLAHRLPQLTQSWSRLPCLKETHLLASGTRDA